MSEAQHTETWRPIPGHDGYFASDLGRIRSDRGHCRKAGWILSPQKAVGYHKVQLGRHSPQQVHRLVLLAFVGPCPDGHNCNHKNGVKTDNRLENLEWVTFKEQMRHACEVLGFDYSNRRRPTQRRGEAHQSARFKESDVREMRRLYATGQYTFKNIGEMFSARASDIHAIVRRIRWAHVT